jgi:uncharacterized damage-inducible protein DinB
MDVAEALLESWERQCRIVDAVASRIEESNRHLKPSEDGWTLDKQLAHIHETRYYWLNQVSPTHAARLGESFNEDGTTPLSLETIKAELAKRGKAIGDVVREMLASGATTAPPYDHPVLFLQHMVWHEGWHVGLIFLGLRLGGQEPPEQWECENVWGEWRVEEWEQ